MSFYSLWIVFDQNFRVFIIMEIGSKYRCSATYMAAKLSRKWSFFALNELFDEPICTPLHFIGNLNMAPSKKWICQLILLHYNLPCKSIKKIQTDLNLGWLFFRRKGFDTTTSLSWKVHKGAFWQNFVQWQLSGWCNILQPIEMAAYCDLIHWNKKVILLKQLQPPDCIFQSICGWNVVL